MNLDQLRIEIQPLREALLAHPLYGDLKSPPALRTFMQYHVFAVWDFMSLLKALQQRLTCVSLPWIPVQKSSGGRLINEIVLGEESDEDGHGGHASHFDLYHNAMQKCGADTSVIDQFLNELRTGLSVQQALRNARAPNAVRDFVLQTFDVIEAGDLCAIASTFAFGREDLLPEVFRQILDHLSDSPSCDLNYFRYYLQRHIDLDGEQHGPMAENLVEHLCEGKETKWRAAEDAALRALESRLRLWDRVQSSLAAPSKPC